MDGSITVVERYLIKIFGFNTLMQWEDVIGIVCALLLGHILTMLFYGHFQQKTIRDNKLAGFSVVRVDGEDGKEDRFRINPHSTIENVDATYNVFWVWLFGADGATFHDLVRVKKVQVIFVVLFIILSFIGIALSIHVTNYVPTK